MSKGFYSQAQQYDAAHALAAKNGTTAGRWPEDDRIEAERAARETYAPEGGVPADLFNIRNKPE